MSKEIAQLYSDLNSETARFKVPFKSLFLCGGTVSPIEDAPPASLRDYIYRTRNLRLSCKIVRAEEANQLYRDTSYSDLIDFEEDIARVATIVLVIAESPGSLSELGAFTVSLPIRRSLRIIAQTKYQDAESFIRFGPIERIHKPTPDNVGFYPWRVAANGRFLASSARPHFVAIKNFIREHIEKAPKTKKLNSSSQHQKQFYIVYWAIYLLYAASVTVIFESIKSVYPNMTISDLKNKIYCMRLMGWIDKESYSNKEYYFALGSEDPVEYHFPKHIKNKDAIERAGAIRTEVDPLEKIPKHINTLVSRRRASIK